MRGLTRKMRSPLVRYGCAVVSVGVALLMTRLLGTHVTGGVSPLFFAAIMLSAYVGGMGAGLVATLLSSASTALLVSPPQGGIFFGWDDASRLVIFVAVALLISWLQHANEVGRRRLEEAHEQADASRRAAVAANAAKDRFLNVLGHELRNPLNPILAAVTLRLQEEVPDAQWREDLEMIRRNVEVEARLIDDLLDSSRIRSGKLRLVRQGVDLMRLLTEVVDAVRPTAQRKDLELSLQRRPRISAAPARPDDQIPIVDGDPIRLRQVFWNLLNNAIKFTEEGSIAVQVRPSVGRRGVIISVSDTGVGIPSSALIAVFEPFVQAPSPRPSVASETHPSRVLDGGLGLGLSIAQGFVQAHGGSMRVRSQLGQGTTFRLKLPAAWVAPSDRPAEPETRATPQRPLQAAEVLEQRPERLEPANRAELLGEEQQKGLRILLVEDHRDTARVTARLLRSREHKVEIAFSAAQALEVAAQHPFDLVISDIGLGDANGCDLMAQLRDRYGLCGIAVSGYATESDVQRSRAAGFIAHLVKPVSFDALCEQIDATADAIADAEDVAAMPLR